MKLRATLGSIAARCVVALSLVHLCDARALKGGFHAGKNIELSGTQQTSAIVSAPHPSTLALEQANTTQGSWDLRLCNAYAYEGWVHVFHSDGLRSGMSYTKEGDGEKRLTEESGPLPYKRCADILGVSLSKGSLLKFRISGDMHIGTFFVEQLPVPGAMLQLVLKRRDTWSTAAAFSSHIFAVSKGPQIALVNTYLGKAKSKLEVRDVLSGVEHLQEVATRQQEVHFGGVVDMATGNYEWRLMDDSGMQRRYAEKASVEFKAVEGKAYTVLRVGAEAVGGQSFPEELIVWPSEGVQVHRGSGASSHDDKGLFGIPKDLSKESRRDSRRSGASSQQVNSVALVIAASLARVASTWM